jgi:hypothetical protein
MIHWRRRTKSAENVRGKGSHLYALVALTFLALLGSLTTGSASIKAFATAVQAPVDGALSAAPDELVLTSPEPRHAIVCETILPLRSGTPALSGTAADVDVATGPASHLCSSVVHRGALVRASILKKYLDFQESLTSP